MTTGTSRKGHCHGTFYAGAVEMEVHECGGCGVFYGVSAAFAANRRGDHKTFYCPNGCHPFFSGESDEEELRRKLRVEQDRRARIAAELDQTKASLRGTKAAVTRYRNRAKAGVCPAKGCRRHFADLERHIASKHPDFERHTHA